MADEGRAVVGRLREARRRDEALHRRRGARGVPGRRHVDVAPVHRPPDQPVPRGVRPDQEEGSAQGPLRAQVHAGLRGFGCGSVAWPTRTPLATEVAADPDPADRRPTADARRRAPGRGGAAGRPARARAPPRGAVAAPRRDPALGARGARVSPASPACWRCGGSRRRLVDRRRPGPDARRRPGERASTTGTAASSGTDFAASASACSRATRSAWASASCSASRSGSFRSVEAFFESPIGFLRYIPATALTPLFLLWLGIDETPKVALIIAGTVFYNILMIADVARGVPRELIATSYTLGAGRTRVLRRVDPPALRGPASSTSPASTSPPRG